LTSSLEARRKRVSSLTMGGRRKKDQITEIKNWKRPWEENQGMSDRENRSWLSRAKRKITGIRPSVHPTEK